VIVNINGEYFVSKPVMIKYISEALNIPKLELQSMVKMSYREIERIFRELK
jgi:hypothetical protein